MQPQEIINKLKYKTIPVSLETFNALADMRRDLPAAGGKTKKERWDDLLNRLILVWRSAGIVKG